MRIKSVFSPYPFKELKILAPESFSSNPDADHNPDERGKPQGKGGIPDTEDVGQRPRGSESARTVGFDDEDIDPALQQVRIEKVRATSDKPTVGIGYNPVFDPENLADTEVGLTGSSLPGTVTEVNGTVPLNPEFSDKEKEAKHREKDKELKNSKAIPPNQRLELVKNVVELFASDNELKLRYLPVENLDSHCYYRFDKEGNARTWFYSNDALKLNRRALFVKLVNGSKSVYLLEIESKGTTDFALYYFSQPREGFNAQKFLQEIVKFSGKNLKENVFSVFFDDSEFDTTRHTQGEKSSFADTVNSKLKSKLNLKAFNS